MSIQLPLFDSAGYPRGFWKWAQANESIVKGFIALARRAQRRGMRHWSADAICHVLRFETAWRERSATGFKLNNNMVAGLSRLAMERCPQLKGFFETRERGGDDADQTRGDGLDG